MQMSTALLPRASQRHPGLPELGTAFTGSELIISFYELRGPRGSRINVKHARQPRRLGECHTLTKLKAAVTPGRSWGLHMRRCEQDSSLTKLLFRSGAPEPCALSGLGWNCAFPQPREGLSLLPVCQQTRNPALILIPT